MCAYCRHALPTCMIVSSDPLPNAPGPELPFTSKCPNAEPQPWGVHAGRLPLSLLALSHQPDVTHSNYTCAMLARPAHHAPRLDASRRTPGALHPEPKFNVLGHFADGLLFYFLIARARRRVPLPALALGWTMDMVSGQPLAIGVPPPFGSRYHMVSGGYDTERGRRHSSHREPRSRNHRRRSFRSDRVTTTYPRHSHSHIMRTYLNVLGAFLHGRTERPPKEASLPLL